MRRASAAPHCPAQAPAASGRALRPRRGCRLSCTSTRLRPRRLACSSMSSAALSSSGTEPGASSESATPAEKLRAAGQRLCLAARTAPTTASAAPASCAARPQRRCAASAGRTPRRRSGRPRRSCGCARPAARRRRPAAGRRRHGRSWSLTVLKWSRSMITTDSGCRSRCAMRQHRRQHVVEVAAVEQPGEEVARGLLLAAPAAAPRPRRSCATAAGWRLPVRRAPLGAAPPRVDALAAPASCAAARSAAPPPGSARPRPAARARCAASASCAARCSACAGSPSRSCAAASAWKCMQRTRRLSPRRRGGSLQLQRAASAQRPRAISSSAWRHAQRGALVGHGGAGEHAAGARRPGRRPASRRRHAAPPAPASRSARSSGRARPRRPAGEQPAHVGQGLGRRGPGWSGR